MCDNCKGLKSRTLLLLSTALQPLYPSPDASLMAQKFFTVANDVLNTESDAEQIAAAGTANRMLESGTISTPAVHDIVHTLSCVISTAELLRDLAAGEVTRRYQAGDRNLPPKVLDKLAQFTQLERMAGAIAVFIEEGPTELERDTRGFPIMPPSKHVS